MSTAKRAGSSICSGFRASASPDEQARDLLDHPDPEVRAVISPRCSDLEPEILFYLSRDPDASRSAG